MPRNGIGVFSPPAGTAATTLTPLNSAAYNLFLADLTADLNAARPIVAGGTGATTAAAALVNLGITATAAELNALDGVTASAAELNILDGATLTVTELNYVDGVTSAIQTQLDGKQASGATLTSLEALTLVAGDTIYATAADTLARLPKGTAGQKLVMNAGATAPVWDVADYESTLTTWVVSTSPFTFTHGLGRAPKWITVTFVCKVADGGWAVGDECQAPNDFSGGTRGLLWAFNSTSIFVKANGAVYLPEKTGASFVTPDSTKWDIRVRAGV